MPYVPDLDDEEFDDEGDAADKGAAITPRREPATPMMKVILGIGILDLVMLCCGICNVTALRIIGVLLAFVLLGANGLLALKELARIKASTTPQSKTMIWWGLGLTAGVLLLVTCLSCGATFMYDNSLN